ncbi:MAG: hypothetical protein ABSF72_00205 [Candidatus Sulfotelmatobacter sp.]|jgi:hypothetical protein
MSTTGFALAEKGTTLVVRRSRQDKDKIRDGNRAILRVASLDQQR